MAIGRIQRERLRERETIRQGLEAAETGMRVIWWCPKSGRLDQRGIV